MSITLIYIVGSALESYTYRNVRKFKVGKHYIKIWYKSGKYKVRVKEDLSTIRSMTIKGW